MSRSVDIILLQPHTHADKRHPIGAPLTVTERDAVWLVREGVAKLARRVPGLHINTPNNPADESSTAAGEPAAASPADTTDTDPSTGDSHE